MEGINEDNAGTLDGVTNLSDKKTTDQQKISYNDPGSLLSCLEPVELQPKLPATTVPILSKYLTQEVSY